MLGARGRDSPGRFPPRGEARGGRGAAEGRPKGEIKAILVAQIDTASGVVNDIKAIGEAVRAAGHDALLMVDAVASLGCMPFEMDAWGVDVAMSGSQKGLMTPPGLGFVAAGPRASEAHKNADLRTPYWDWTFARGRAALPEICRHAAEHLLFALRAALDMIFAEGFENVFNRHRLLARGDAPRGRHLGRGAGDRLQYRRAGGALRHRDRRRHARRRERAAARRLLPREMRRGARPRLGPLRGQGVPHRPYGPCQRADDAGHAERGRDGACGARDSAWQGRRRRRRSSIWRRAVPATSSSYGGTRQPCRAQDSDSFRVDARRASSLANRCSLRRTRASPARRSCARRVSRMRSFSLFARTIRLIASGAMPDFAAISRSCCSITAFAGSSPSMPPSMSAGTRRLERWVPSS